MFKKLRDQENTKHNVILKQHAQREYRALAIVDGCKRGNGPVSVAKKFQMKFVPSLAGFAGICIFVGFIFNIFIIPT